MAPLPGGAPSRPPVQSALAQAARRTPPEAHEEGLAASGCAAAATITPCTAASRASFEAPRRGGLPAVPSTVDLEAGDTSRGAGANEPLLEPVALADRITLEFRDVDCYVPRLFGPGSAKGPLARSATLLRSVASLGLRKASASSSAKADAKAPSTRQVRVDRDGG